MKFPKKIRTYCPKCGTHTIHTVSIYKHGKRRKLSEGERRYKRKKEGYGSQRKPEQKRFAKVTKKVLLKVRCSKCGYTTYRLGIRLKKIELIDIMR